MARMLGRRATERVCWCRDCGNYLNHKFLKRRKKRQEKREWKK